MNVRIGPPWIVLGLYAERLRTVTAITVIMLALTMVTASRAGSRGVKPEGKVEVRSSAHPMRAKGNIDRYVQKNNVFTLMGSLR